MTCSGLTSCSPERPLLSAGVVSQPGGQIGRAGEIEQRLSQGLQLIQRQSLDAGDGERTSSAHALIGCTGYEGPPLTLAQLDPVRFAEP